MTLLELDHSLDPSSQRLFLRVVLQERTRTEHAITHTLGYVRFGKSGVLHLFRVEVPFPPSKLRLHLCPVRSACASGDDLVLDLLSMSGGYGLENRLRFDSLPSNPDVGYAVGLSHFWHQRSVWWRPGPRFAGTLRSFEEIACLEHCHGRLLGGDL